MSIIKDLNVIIFVSYILIYNDVLVKDKHERHLQVF